MVLLRPFLIAVLLLLLSVKTLSASEIRIQDARGLIRFSSPTKDPKSLLVVLSSKGRVKEVRLEQEDGFREPVLGRRIESGEYVFRDIAPGRYRIYVEPGSISVKQVSLKK